jgi:hypothetical protein
VINQTAKRKTAAVTIIEPILCTILFILSFSIEFRLFKATPAGKQPPSGG